MTDPRHFCDKCGSVIVEDRTVLTVQSGSLRDRQPEVELCRDCAPLLISWLRSGAQAEQFELQPAG